MDFNSDYCVEECVSWIQERNFKKVALQLPDNLLEKAHQLCKAIENIVGFQVYVLGDTTFNSCCVDEVTSEHIGADTVIHFGASCLSMSQRLPVLHVLGPSIPIDTERVVEILEKSGPTCSEKLILTCDTLCCSQIDALRSRLHMYKNLFIATLAPSRATYLTYPGLGSIIEPEIDSIHSEGDDKNRDTGGNLYFHGRKVELPKDYSLNDFNFIYIGDASPTLSALRMRFPSNTFYHVTPCGDTIQCCNSIKGIMGRSSKIDQIKDASIIGILIGTLGVANYKQIISNLKRLIKASNKRSYTFVIGKLNEPKLANLDVVDVFVHVACAESTYVDRQEDPYLYRKIVSPWEVYLALSSSVEWSMAHKLDFREILEDPSFQFQAEEKDEISESNTENPVHSLEIALKANMDLKERTAGALAPIHEGGAGAKFSHLTWQGLEQNIEGPPPGTVVEGRRGIASSYSDEIK